MRRVSIIWIFILLSVSLSPISSTAQTVKQKESIKENDAKIAEYKKWLDQVGSKELNYWLRLDSGHRPHRLYVGEGFVRADYTEKERFIEIFSRYLAGVPDKNMLIDIYDASSGKAIGEYGFGGFRLF
jgi:hypothetical protein